MRERIFSDRLRLLQLETLYDLALSLHAGKGEQDVAEELLGRVCGVLDPAAGVIVTRDGAGEAVACASVGWSPEGPPAGADLLAAPLFSELLSAGHATTRQEGVLCEHPYRELVAVPIVYRSKVLGYLALVDKEERGGERSWFSDEDRRFLESVAALGGISIDSSRQIELLEAQRDRLEEENRALKGRLSHAVSGRRIVAQAPATQRVLEMAERVAPRGVTVLLRGESGTGKELIAKLIHLLSGRKGPLVALNCAALPETLLESELFGIEGGVATGVQARRGKIELSSGGTLFLDEIGDAPLPVQVRLLRALQEREVVRVGGQRPVPVELRLVTATHQSLETLVSQGKFREDLYYRLKGVEIELPPLRERREDIPHLVRNFLEEFCRREGIGVPAIGAEALALLMAYDYPGNVRELQNLIEGAASLSDGSIDGALVRSLVGSASAAASGPEPLALEALERRHIQKVIRLTGGNKAAAARLLGLNRRTLVRKGY